MIVYLVGFKKTVRAVRVSWSFGATKIRLVGSPHPDRRYLFSARRMPIEEWNKVPDDVLILEVRGKIPLQEVDWSLVSGVAVGGPSTTLKTRGYMSARVDASPPCLIGDQALGIALYARSLAVSPPR